MTLKTSGFRRVRGLLERLPETTKRQLAEANSDNAALIVRTAKVLVPVGKSGRAKAAIKSKKEGDGQLIDFGPLSSVLEGGTQDRYKKTGAYSGKSPKRPFVNPAMKATRKKRTLRAQKAVRAAIREAKNG